MIKRKVNERWMHVLTVNGETNPYNSGYKGAGNYKCSLVNSKSDGGSTKAQESSCPRYLKPLNTPLVFQSLNDLAKKNFYRDSMRSLKK